MTMSAAAALYQNIMNLFGQNPFALQILDEVRTKNIVAEKNCVRYIVINNLATFCNVDICYGGDIPPSLSFIL